jgi:hypothetical protein
MTRENGRDEEPRELARVPEEPQNGAGLENGNVQADNGWLEAGAEDPAFYLKPSDAE